MLLVTAISTVLVFIYIEGMLFRTLEVKPVVQESLKNHSIRLPVEWSRDSVLCYKKRLAVQDMLHVIYIHIENDTNIWMLYVWIGHCKFWFAGKVVWICYRGNKMAEVVYDIL